MSLEDKVKPVEATLKIPFDSIRHAEIAHRVLTVDQEPRRNFVCKDLLLVGDLIEVHFKADQTQTMPEHTPAPTPHRAIYGYAFYLVVISLFVMYFLWALLPTKEWGLTYLPDKYFAVLLPMLVLVGLSFFAFLIYPAINMTLTPEIDEMASAAAVNLILRGKSRNPMQSWSDIQQELDNTNISNLNVGNNISNCKYCSGNHHKHEVSEQIDTLRFIDLAEINRKLFE